LEAGGPEGIRRAARAAGVLTVERAILDGSLELRAVLVEAEGQLAVRQLAGSRGHLLIAVEEGSLDARPAAGALEPERHRDRALVLSGADDDGGIPESGERLPARR